MKPVSGYQLNAFVYVPVYALVSVSARIFLGKFIAGQFEHFRGKINANYLFLIWIPVNNFNHDISGAAGDI